MATSNETFGLMKPGEELVVRLTPDARRYYFFIRKSTAGVGTTGERQAAGMPGGVNSTTYTSAATMATAIQNAMPTLYS